MIKFFRPSNTLEAKKLLYMMGIHEIIPPVSFTRIKQKEVIEDVPNTRQTQLLNKSIKLNDCDISYGKDRTLEINGVKACAYIMEQRFQRNPQDFYNGISSYRYHLCNCKTMQEMQRDGRIDRYVATSRDDGLFEVIATGIGRNNNFPLELCSNCKTILIENNIFFNPFSLNDYYNKYRSTIPTHVKKISVIEEIEQYSPDHDQIANKYKEASGYKCSCCGVCCENSKYLLHMHHVNGNGKDNSHGNLRILCTICHSEQPRHSHMYVKEDYIEEIKVLRSAQGIHKLT